MIAMKINGLLVNMKIAKRNERLPLNQCLLMESLDTLGDTGCIRKWKVAIEITSWNRKSTIVMEMTGFK
jgi:hypothetical protein